MRDHSKNFKIVLDFSPYLTKCFRGNFRGGSVLISTSKLQLCRKAIYVEKMRLLLFPLPTHKTLRKGSKKMAL